MADRFTFRFGDIVDPDDVLSQWFVALSMGVNDLILVTHRLVRGLESTRGAHENVYDARLAAMHAWEVLKLLDQGEGLPEVAAFVSGLPDRARTDHEAALAVLRSDDETEFKSALGRSRDYFGHYPDLTRAGKKELARISKHLADEQVEAYNGTAFGDFRALYADAVATQLFFRHRPEDREALEEFVTELRELSLRLMRFGGAVLNS